MQDKNRKTEYLIFAGQQNPGHFTFIRFDNSENIDLMKKNPDLIDSFRSVIYDRKLFKSATIGGIYEINIDPEKPDTIFYNKDAKPIAYCIDDRVKSWKVADQATREIVAIDKHAKESAYKTMLLPIRRAYQYASHQQRSMIIADVVRFITSGN